MKKHRHWLFGILGGLLLGVAFWLGTIIYSINTLGVATPWVALVIGLVIGVLMIFVPSRKARRARRMGPPPAPTY